MKIALWNNLPSGGAKRAWFEIASGLLARGHRLESWCPPTADRDFLPLATLMPEHVVPYDPPRPRGWQKLLPGPWGYGRHLRAMDRHARACAEAINAGGFDVVLAANCQDHGVTSIARHVKIPAVIYCQEPKRDRYEAALAGDKVLTGLRATGAIRALNHFWRDVDIRHERLNVRAFARVLVNSAYSRESLLRSYGCESQVCPLGINTGLFRPTGVARERFVLGLGALQRHKDPATSIEAIAAIPEEERPELVLIGNMADEGYINELTVLAARLGVRFSPRRMVSDTAVVDTLNRAAVLLYTSRLEPFGFAPLEANACGTPVVGVAEGGIRETVRMDFNGLLVPDRDPKQLGLALLALLRDPERARRLGENGRAWVTETWTWRACVDRIETELGKATSS
jgi:glycosyltransferase involved in cell wall biosynthesis